MHEVVNGANGSVTWCGGPAFCPSCRERQTVNWLTYPTTATIVMPSSQVTYLGQRLDAR